MKDFITTHVYLKRNDFEKYLGWRSIKNIILDAAAKTPLKLLVNVVDALKSGNSSAIIFQLWDMSIAAISECAGHAY